MAAAVIEIPRGSKVKYELDKKSGGAVSTEGQLQQAAAGGIVKTCLT